MRKRIVRALVLARRVVLTTAAVAAALSPGGASAAALDAREGGSLVWRDGEARFLASSALGFEARRQPAPEPPPAKPLHRRQRPNTVSLGVQGQYGAVRGNSRLADGFDNGPGYAFRFRYMLSTSAALGFSFENQRFGSIQTPVDVPGEFADSHVVATTVAVEGVFFINREQEFTPYFIGGFGYATPDIVFKDLITGGSNVPLDVEQSTRANEGVFAVVGAGFERFFRPRASLDVSIRGFALVSNSEFTSMGQVSVGIHLYPGD